MNCSVRFPRRRPLEAQRRSQEEAQAEQDAAAEQSHHQDEGPAHEPRPVRAAGRQAGSGARARRRPGCRTAADAASSSSSGSTSGAKGGTISALTISPLGNSVKLKLDGKKYTVDEGEQFAKSYRLYDIFNANCAGFLYGDQNAVVCEGDSVSIG